MTMVDPCLEQRHGVSHHIKIPRKIVVTGEKPLHPQSINNGMHPQRTLIEAAKGIKSLQDFQSAAGDIAHRIGKLDGEIERHEQMGRGNDAADGIKQRDELHTEFKDLVGDANVAGHDPHKLGITSFRNKGVIDAKNFHDNSHMDERDRKNAFDVYGGEQHTGKRNDRENLERYGNKPGPYALGYTSTAPSKEKN
jgi:hypothetical protein